MKIKTKVVVIISSAVALWMINVILTQSVEPQTATDLALATVNGNASNYSSSNIFQVVKNSYGFYAMIFWSCFIVGLFLDDVIKFVKEKDMK